MMRLALRPRMPGPYKAVVVMVVAVMAMTADCLTGELDDAFQRAYFDSILMQANTDPAPKTIALDILRNYANWNLKFPDSIAFLESVTADDFTDDEVHRMWPAVQIALHQARLNQFETWVDKVRFLEGIVTSNAHDVILGGKLSSWAIEELCDHGALSSLPIVREYVNRRAGSGASEQVRFCALRMRLLSSHPERISALGSALQAGSFPAEPKLMRWAIGELTSMASSRANRELERFELQVLALPYEAPQRLVLMNYANRIYAALGYPPSRRLERDGQPRPMYID